MLLNTWEAVYFDHRLDRLTALANAAAAVGVERFVLDDGWFGGRRHDRAGLGDWVVSADLWPDGLGPLITHVRALGMEFGLWVEPEMVNLDSDLVRAHPDWVLGVAGRVPMSWRHQQVLDLANPDAFAHILERLDARFARTTLPSSRGPQPRPGRRGPWRAAAVHGQTLAVYRLLDELRERHPGVEIETCASGVAASTSGSSPGTDRLWASDTIDAHERPISNGGRARSCRRSSSARTSAQAWRTRPGGGIPSPSRGMALFGHLGIEADLTAVDEVDRRRIADAVAQHKRLRPLLHTGTVVRLRRRRRQRDGAWRRAGRPRCRGVLICPADILADRGSRDAPAPRARRGAAYRVLPWRWPAARRPSSSPHRPGSTSPVASSSPAPCSWMSASRCRSSTPSRCCSSS